jgi:hypothetical protein
MCRISQIAPSAYGRHPARPCDPLRRSAREKRNAALLPDIQRA